MAFLAGQAAASATKDGGLLNQLIKIIVILLVVIFVVIIAVVAYLIIDNWTAIGIWFTTGWVGYLNPFDSDEGDAKPFDEAKQAILGSGPILIWQLLATSWAKPTQWGLLWPF